MGWQQKKKKEEDGDEETVKKFMFSHEVPSTMVTMRRRRSGLWAWRRGSFSRRKCSRLAASAPGTGSSHTVAWVVACGSFAALGAAVGVFFGSKQRAAYSAIP